jgi:hypothetical protein
MTKTVLSTIEKLDGQHPGLAFNTKNQFDRGVPVKDVTTFINNQYPVTVSEDVVGRYRTKVWAPDREKIHETSLLIRMIVKDFGGDSGIDALASAQIFEILMAEKDWTKLTGIRALLCKTRAQTLKEQEFLFKSGQLEMSGDSRGESEEPETETMSAVDRIKAIFGISPDAPPNPPSPVVPPAVVKESS